MIEITFKQLVESRQALQELANLELDIDTAYIVSKTIAACDNEFKIFNKLKDKLIEKYGTKNEQGILEVKQDSKNYSIFNSELTKLLDKKIKIKLDDSLSITNLRKIKGLKLKPIYLYTLNWLIKK